MSTFSTKCPHCSGELEVESSWIGMTLECPLCKVEFTLQGEGEAPPAEKSCPFCGNMINYKATRCKFCKQELPQEVQQIQAQDTGTGGKSRRKRYVFVALGGILFLAVAGGGIFFKMAREAAIEQDFKRVIYLGHMVLEQPDSTQEDCTRAINDIEKTIKNFPSHNPDEANAMIKKLEEKHKSLAFLSSMETLKQLKFNSSEHKTNIAIRKKINLNNDCNLFIFPADRKEHVQMIYQKIGGICKSVKQFKKHHDEAKRLNQQASNTNVTGIDSYNKSTDILNQAHTHIEKSRQAILQAKNYHEQVKQLLLQEALDMMNNFFEPKCKVFNFKNNVCDVTNVRGKVILLAVETINWGSGFESYQAWYLEYTPHAPKTWELY